jgi:hypothetical protein
MRGRTCAQFRRRVVPRRAAPRTWWSSRSSRPAAYRSSPCAYRLVQEPKFAGRALARLARARASSCARARVQAAACPAEAERAGGKKMVGRDGREACAGDP